MKEQQTFAQKIVPIYKKMEPIIAAGAALSIAAMLSGTAGAGVYLRVSLGTLALIYMMLGFLTAESAIPRWIISVTYTGAAIICITLLFKMQFWTGSRSTLFIGMAGLGFGFAGITSKREEKGANTIFIRTAIFSVIGIALTMVSNGDLAKVIYKDDPVMVEKIIKLENNPYNEAYHKELQEYRRTLQQRR